MFGLLGEATFKSKKRKSILFQTGVITITTEDDTQMDNTSKAE